MSSLPSIDPLEAVDLLAGEISGSNSMPADIARLIRAIDMFMYSIHLISADVPPIEETDLEAPRPDYQQIYEALKLRYPTLGYYWLALYPIVKDGAEGELAVGDAIDDLADILIELSEVRWFDEHADRNVALAALRARYDMHLWMHVPSLRQYLEEVKRDD